MLAHVIPMGRCRPSIPGNKLTGWISVARSFSAPHRSDRRIPQRLLKIPDARLEKQAPETESDSRDWTFH